MLLRQHDQFGHVFLQLLRNEAAPGQVDDESISDKDDKNPFPIIIPHTNKMKTKRDQQ